MSTPRLLVAGIGNIFLGDDGFGVEVAQRLLERRLPSEVRVVDFGIRGIDLTYALLERYEAVILVDATRRGGPPGTVYVIQPEVNAADRAEAAAEMDASDLLIQAHSLEPANVLRLSRSLGSPVQRVLLVGCEPEPLEEGEELPLGLSEPAQRAVPEAAALVERLAKQLLAGEPVSAAG